MPAIGSFLANMLLGGLQEGQRRREAQTTILPHLLNLLSTQQYRQAQVGFKSEDEARKDKEDALKVQKLKADRKSRVFRDQLAGALADVKGQGTPGFFGGTGFMGLGKPVDTSRLESVVASMEEDGASPALPSLPAIPSSQPDAFIQHLTRQGFKNVHRIR